MSTIARRNLDIFGTVSGNMAKIFYGKEAAAQNFKKGELLAFSSGKLQACVSDATSIAGVACHDASGETNKPVAFHPVDDLILVMNATAVTTLINIGNVYELEVSGNKHYIDNEATTNQALQVVGFHPDDEIGDLYGRLLVTVIPSANQLKTSSTTVGGATFTMQTNNKVQFRDAAIYIFSSADGVLEAVADGSIKLNSAVNMTGAVNYGLAATADNQAYTLAVPMGDLADGQVVIFKIPAAASAGNSTLNVNSKGARKMLTGSDNATQVGAGDLVANGVYMAVYDSTLDTGSGAWVVINL